MNRILLLIISLSFLFACRATQRLIQTPEKKTQPTVLLIGISHNLAETSQQAVEQIKEEMLTFKPEMFFVEIPPADDHYANELIFKYSQNFALFHHLLDKKNIHIRLADSVILDYRQRLAQEPGNALYAGHLLHAYLLKFDVGNALYQSYLLFGGEALPDSTLAALDEQLFSIDTLDQYRLIVTGKEKDEFSQVVFPVAKALGATQVYGFDNRDNEYAYDRAWRSNDKELRDYVVRKYNLSEEKTIKNKLDTLLGVVGRKAEDSSQLLTYFNSDAYEKYRKQEFLQRLMLTPSENSRNYLKYWTLRNEKMADNVQQQLNRTNATKAVVVVGAAHTWIIEEMLKDKGFRVERPFE